MMITAPITAEVIENPMKTLACNVQEKQENINQNIYQWWIQGRVLENPPPLPPSPISRSGSATAYMKVVQLFKFTSKARAIIKVTQPSYTPFSNQIAF